MREGSLNAHDCYAIYHVTDELMFILGDSVSQAFIFRSPRTSDLPKNLSSFDNFQCSRTSSLLGSSGRGPVRAPDCSSMLRHRFDNCRSIVRHSSTQVSNESFNILQLQRVAPRAATSDLATVVPSNRPVTDTVMLKISTVETQSERRLIIEGKLISPWVGELRKSWKTAAEDLNGRKLVVDLTNTTVISTEGQETLVGLMKEGARFSGCGVLTKHILKAMAASCHDQVQNVDKKNLIS